MAAVSNGRGLNLYGAISNGRINHDSVALANEHISIAHVIREAFGAQVDRQILVWKSGRRRCLRLTCRLVCSSWSLVRPTTRSVLLVRHPGGTSSAAGHGTPSHSYGSGRTSVDCCHPRVKPC